MTVEPLRTSVLVVRPANLIAECILENSDQLGRRERAAAPTQNVAYYRYKRLWRPHVPAGRPFQKLPISRTSRVLAF